MAFMRDSLRPHPAATCPHVLAPRPARHSARRASRESQGNPRHCRHACDARRSEVSVFLQFRSSRQHISPKAEHHGLRLTLRARAIAHRDTAAQGPRGGAPRKQRRGSRKRRAGHCQRSHLRAAAIRAHFSRRNTRQTAQRLCRRFESLGRSRIRPAAGEVSVLPLSRATHQERR